MDHVGPPISLDGGPDLAPQELAAAVPQDPAAVWPALTTLAAALPKAPVWRLGDEDLVERVRAFEAVRAQLEAHRLTVIRELDDRGWAARVGAASTQAWLAQAVRCDPWL
jgi:hypothetical protein